MGLHASRRQWARAFPTRAGGRSTLGHVTGSRGEPGASPPLFTIVSAVRDVARYLPDFISAIEAQTLGPEALQIVMVDDASSDGSTELLQRWRDRSPRLVTLIITDTGGQAEARNVGLAEARGVWVTFTDPDDVLDRQYLAQVAAFLDRCPTTPDLVATNLLILDEARARVVDEHPLRFRFLAGDRVVDMTAEPDHFQLSAASAFFPLRALRDSQRSFDARVRPNFEDGHLIARYLLTRERPTLGLVASARYHYRRRADGSSTLQGARRSADRYTALLRHGYLDALRAAVDERASVPTWLQNTIVYELAWLLGSEEPMNAPPNAAGFGVADEFHALMEQITGMLDPAVVADFAVLALPAARTAAIAHGYRPESWHDAGALVEARDADQGLVRLSYLYTCDPPSELFRAGAAVLTPMHGKARGVVYSGRALVHERIAWVDAGVTELELDGVDVPLWVQRPPARQVDGSAPLRKALARSGAVMKATGRRRAKQTLGWAARAHASQPRTALRFADAWVLMDRDLNARDNAEHLFRYVRGHKPDINAWFVLRRESADFGRLQAEFGDRVIPYGTREWVDLCLSARHLLSSHADEYVVRPPALRRLGPLRWRFTFLQHGVTQNDLSAWLNPKPIDLMLAVTSAEYHALVDDGTPYGLTSKEVTLTGFPRHDRLLGLNARNPADERSSLLVMPTWRMSLLGPMLDGSSQRGAVAGFTDSAFALAWSSLLQSPQFASAAADAGLQVVFLPHPNFAPYLSALNLPTHVRVASHSEVDVQEMLVSAGLVVTDYSSLAFDAALIERPVVYFQFDREDLYGGAHLTKPGYFSYPDDGFGPVAEDEPSVLAAIEEALAAAPSGDPTYLARMRATFPLRDEGSCARVVAEVLAAQDPADASARGGLQRS